MARQARSAISSLGFSWALQAMQSLRTSRCASTPLTAALLVEALVEGPEFSVEVFSGRVIGITRKHLGAPPAFVEAGHDYPAVVSADVARALTAAVTRGTELLGLGWGPLHWELRMQGGRAWAIEVNPRLAGGFIPELVRHAEGIDLIRETLRLVVGQAPELDPARHRHASIRFLFAPGAGRLDAAAGIEAARAMARRPVICETVRPRFSAATTESAVFATSATSATSTFLSSRLSGISTPPGQKSLTHSGNAPCGPFRHLSIATFIQRSGGVELRKKCCDSSG